MIENFSSKARVKGLFVVPLLVLTIGLLIPQIHWGLSVGISLIIFFIQASKLSKLKVLSNKIEVSYPFSFFRGKLTYDMEALEKVVYVDREKAVRGSYPHSHVNINKKSGETQMVKLMLNQSEIESVKEILNSNKVDFEYTTNMQVKTI